MDLPIYAISLCLLSGGLAKYVGRPLLYPDRNNLQMPPHTAIDTTLNLGNGTVIGFTFLTVEELAPGISTVSPVRMQIWEALTPTHPGVYRYKLVMEQRVELSTFSLGRNITVALPKDKMIALRPNYKLGLTTEGLNNIVAFNMSVYLVVIGSQPGRFTRVGEEVGAMNMKAPYGYIMGIHSIEEGEDNYLTGEVRESTASTTALPAEVTTASAPNNVQQPMLLLFVIVLSLLGLIPSSGAT